MSSAPALTVLRERLKSFFAYARPRLVSGGVDLDRLTQLRRLSDVRIRQFAVGRPHVTGLDLCGLLSDEKSGRFDLLAEDLGLLHRAHLTPPLTPLGEEMAYVVEACLVLQTAGPAMMRDLAAAFVGLQGKAPAPSAAEVAAVPGAARPAPRPVPEPVARLLGQASELWTPPAGAVKVLDMLRTADTPSDLVCREIERDADLARACLRMTNAVRYAPGARIESVKRALATLGYPIMHRIVAAAALAGRLGRRRGELDFDLAGFWRHSLETAHAAARVCRLTRLGHPDEHFFAGLLHDVGKLAAYQFAAPGDQEKAGAIHAAIGACVCERWRLPASIVEAARHHLATPEALEEIQLPREALVVAAVCRVVRDPGQANAGAALLNLPSGELTGFRTQAAAAAKACLEFFLPA
jgi:putative nucleotidyltransferase with HDIG domain